MFYDAEHVPAPPAWYGLSFGAMLAGAPNAKNVPPAYIFSLIDSILYDEEIHDGYGPGFSCPVVVRAIRQLRRTPASSRRPLRSFRACRQHRRKFRDCKQTVDVLIQVRRNAEEVVAEDAAGNRGTAFPAARMAAAGLSRGQLRLPVLSTAPVGSKARRFMLAGHVVRP